MSDMHDHLLITKGPRTGEEIFLTKLPLTIGRDQSVEVTIDLGSISRRHACISQVDDGYQIEDLGSKNGTFLNEERLQSPRRIVDGDQIALGDHVEMRVVIPATREAQDQTVVHISGETGEEKSDATAYFPSSRTADKTMAFQEIPPAPVIPPRLVINEPGEEPKVIPLVAERLRIGRLEDNDIVLNNRFVSRHH